MTEITKAEPSDAGCWIDGHWGQYAVARMVEIAAERGYTDETIVDIAERLLNAVVVQEVTVQEYETLSDAADEVEQWLNDNVAPGGHRFEWNDGEFFLVGAWDEDDRGVRYVEEDEEVPSSFVTPTTCGTCGRTWDDAHVSVVTPVPAGRCPFEYDHEPEPDVTEGKRTALTPAEVTILIDAIDAARDSADANEQEYDTTAVDALYNKLRNL